MEIKTYEFNDDVLKLVFLYFEIFLTKDFKGIIFLKI